LVNAFAYWQGVPVANSTSTYFNDIFQAFSHIQNLNPSAEMWTGECGWPTTGDYHDACMVLRVWIANRVCRRVGGTNYGAAIASTANAETFYSTDVCGMLTWGYNVFYFEAFDEPWKPASVGDSGAASDETHWGAMTASRETKYSLQC